MYKRFYNSLISPKNLIQFRTDSLFRVFLYVLFFALLLSTRVTIDIITYDGLSNSSKEVIKQEFIDVNETCIITSGELECTRADSTLVFESLTMSFHTDSYDNWNPSIYNEYGYNIVMHDDKVDLVVAGQSLLTMTIDEFSNELQNFNFDTYDTDKDEFFTVIFGATDEIMLKHKDVWGSIMVGFDFIANIFMFMLFILLSSWMLRIRFKQIKFKHLFTMSAYSSTALFVIMIIDSLYNMSFFIVLLLLFVAIRQNSQLSLELHRRLTKKP